MLFGPSDTFCSCFCSCLQVGRAETRAALCSLRSSRKRFLELHLLAAVCVGQLVFAARSNVEWLAKKDLAVGKHSFICYYLFLCCLLADSQWRSHVSSMKTCNCVFSLFPLS